MYRSTIHCHGGPFVPAIPVFVITFTGVIPAAFGRLFPDKDSRVKRPANPKALSAGPIDRVQPHAEGRASEIRREVPGTAAKGTPTAISRSPSRPVGRCSIVVIVRTILRPFQYIAVHLVETPGIWLEGLDRQCSLSILAVRAPTIHKVTVVIRLLRRDRTAPPERRGRSCPRRIFAFGFAQQAVRPSRLARQPFHISLRVVPGTLHHSTAATAPALI